MVMSNDARDKWRELSAWRELLKPWLNALRHAQLRVELPPLHSVSDREDLWFSLDFPMYDDAFLTIVQAMEMIDLVARIDRDCAWRLLFENAGRHAALLLPLYGEALWNTRDGPVFPQYELKINGGEDSACAFGHLKHLRNNDISESAHERSIKQMLLARVDDPRRGSGALDRSRDGYVKLRFKLKIVGTNTPAITGVMSKVGYLASDLRYPSTSKLPGVYPFRLKDRGVFQCHSYRIKFRDGPLSSEIVTTLHNMQDERMPLTHIVLPPMYSHSASCFLAATTSLRVGKLDDNGVRALFSAIATSQNLPAMTFEPGFRDPEDNTNTAVVADPELARPDTYWPWLAYALFSAKSRHGAMAVKINITGLTDDHVSMMEEVLQDSEPLMLLQQTATGVIVPRLQSTCWWPRAQAPAISTHTISHLSITASWTLGVSFFRLLELVGQPLTRLSLSEIGDAPRHLLLDAVFMHCPNLGHLDLDMLTIESLDWFQYRYRPCHNLHTLCLGGTTAVGVVAAEMGSWTGLFTTLSDPTHALTTTLRHLHVNFSQFAMGRSRANQVVTLNALARMLDVNKRLERVEVAQCEHWMMDALKDRVQTYPDLDVAPAFAQRVCGFYPHRRHQSRNWY